MRASRASSFEKPKTQMQILTRRHVVIIKNYDQMKSMDKNVKWMKLTHLLSSSTLNHGPRLYIYFYFINSKQNLIAF
jgi:hypothetical protein